MTRRRLPRNTPDVLDPELLLTGEVAHATGTVAATSTAGRLRSGDGVTVGGNPVALQRYERPWGLNAVPLAGLQADGTDETAALVALAATLEADEYLLIPPGTRFDHAALKAAMPLFAGYECVDNINRGAGGYTTVRHLRWRNSTAANDINTVISDPHHPGLSLHNDLSSGSESALLARASILHEVGEVDGIGDPAYATMLQWQASGTAWQMNWRRLIEAAIALHLKVWAEGLTVTTTDYVQASSGKLYQVTGAGDLGAAEPTHEAGAAVNGTATLTWVRGGTQSDATILRVSDLGELYIFGPAAGHGRIEARAGAEAVYLDRDGITGDIVLRAGTEFLDLIRLSEANGVTMDGIHSANRQNLSGATPTIARTKIYLTQAGPTDVTDFLLPATHTTNNAIVDVMLGDALSTLVHDPAKINLTNAGGVDLPGPAGGFFTLEKKATYAAAWQFVSKSWT